MQHGSMQESGASWPACVVDVYRRSVDAQGAALAAWYSSQEPAEDDATVDFGDW